VAPDTRVPTQRHVRAGHRRPRLLAVPGLVPVGVAGTAAGVWK